MAKIKIYNSILFGNLRPWLPENVNQDSYLQKPSQKFRCESGLMADYANTLSKVLQKSTDLLNDDDISTSNISADAFNKIIFPEPLINYEMPPHFNPKTEFYYFLIKNEGTRFVNRLYSEIQFAETNSIARVTINDALEHIKFLLTETTSLLRQIGFDENLPFSTDEDTATLSINKDSDYILRILQWALIRLILEVQELFPDQLTAQPLSEDEIYIKFIGTHLPIIKLAKKITVLNEFLIRRFLSQYEFSIKRAVELLEFTKKEFLLYKDTPSSFANITNRNEGLITHILVLENLVFVRCFTDSPENPAYDELLSIELAEKIYQDYTSNIHTLIEQYPTANKRLEFIGNEIDKYSFLKSSYIIDESLFKLSIPRKILKWLLIQKVFLEANLHIDLSKIPIAVQPKIPTDLTVAELAFLFRALYDARLLKPVHDEDLYRAIAAFFSSRNKEDISGKNIKNKFLSPEANAVDYWDTGFTKLLKIATNIRQDLSI
jgi:hypothetical protein